MVFLSRLGKTALDGVAKTKESDQVLQAKNWCTLARLVVFSARSPPAATRECTYSPFFHKSIPSFGII